MGTIARNFARSFRHLCLIVSALLAALSIGAATDTTERAERPTVQGSPSQVLADHDCQPPTGDDFPSAVIVQRVGGGTRYATSDAAIGRALDDALGGPAWAGYRVIAFCR